ncbi:expressed unknown protein [Seminavis robusta]|uniref:Uncharacterized protein n=1 Tax=Seminavis robusta TaxID=568900 RepID=A0A9N8EIA1_9STRA|nr:expressed unknown protein [Seminavis robusta]|eukprot:Sro1238_g255260.1 n/a (533) ;mRNA; f:26701-28483
MGMRASRSVVILCPRHSGYATVDKPNKVLPVLDPVQAEAQGPCDGCAEFPLFPAFARFYTRQTDDSTVSTYCPLTQPRNCFHWDLCHHHDVCSGSKKPKIEQESQSPLSFQSDGITPRKAHLKRDETVDEIYEKALVHQHVVVGSPPSSGKTSLLQLLKLKLRGLANDPTPARINMTSDRSVEELMDDLRDYGITKKVKDLEKVKNTWILIDDAQNAFDEKFNPFWEFLVKHVASVDELKEELIVVIASTYDLNTPKSPVNFADLHHIEPNATEAEARELFNICAEDINCRHMSRFCETLIDISRLASEDKSSLSPPDPPLYHLGVIMAGLRVLKDNKKDQRLRVLSEDDMLQEIRCSNMMNHLNRCFPERLNDLVKRSVESISARRLRDAAKDGFPKEAAFQHLFCEAMSKLLPIQHSVIPELNTFAKNSDLDVVTGELDFYINGSLKWVLELLRNGNKIGEHLQRFDPAQGKYRQVDFNDYLVVDCRSARQGVVHGAGAADRCTLFFADDFKTCVCQMRMKEEIEITLSN